MESEITLDRSEGGSCLYPPPSLTLFFSTMYSPIPRVLGRLGPVMLLW